MLLRTSLEHRTAGWEISILGTDINRACLATAREARYSEWAFRECPPTLKQRCFRRDGKHWTLRPEYKDGVSFEYHNLATDPFPPLGRFDLILCRNVTIYFSPSVIRSTAERFRECLREGGWLLVGHAEPSPDTFRSFRTHSVSGVTLYQNIEPGPEPQVTVALPLPAALPAPPSPPPQRKRAPRPTPEPLLAIGLAGVREMADRGEWTAAAAGCRALLKTDGLSAATHFTFGLILEQTGSLPGA